MSKSKSSKMENQVESVVPTTETAVEVAKTPAIESPQVEEIKITIEQAKAIIEAYKLELKAAKLLAKENKVAKADKSKLVQFVFEQSQKLPSVMSVSVTKSMKSGRDMMHAASGNWKMSEIKALTVKHVMAESDGVIVGAFDVVGTEFRAETQDGPGRYWLELVESEKMAEHIGKFIPKKRGMASPILFNFSAKEVEVETTEPTADEIAEDVTNG